MPKPQNVDVLRSADWYVKPVPLSDARSLVVQYHYAKGGSNTACYTHGLFDRHTDTLHGVAWWLPPTRVACESVNRLDWKRVLSLTRLVMTPDTPKNACSFLLARSVALIRKDGRFVSLVTYADESQQHTGAIYRASNWHYVGRTAPTPRWVDPTTGRQVSCKATVNRNKATMLSLGYVLEGRYSKHKYVLHLEKNKNGHCKEIL